MGFCVVRINTVSSTPWFQLFSNLCFALSVLMEWGIPTVRPKSCSASAEWDYFFHGMHVHVVRTPANEQLGAHFSLVSVCRGENVSEWNWSFIRFSFKNGKRDMKCLRPPPVRFSVSIDRANCVVASSVFLTMSSGTIASRLPHSVIDKSPANFMLFLLSLLWLHSSVSGSNGVDAVISKTSSSSSSYSVGVRVFRNIFRPSKCKGMSTLSILIFESPARR